MLQGIKKGFKGVSKDFSDVPEDSWVFQGLSRVFQGFSRSLRELHDVLIGIRRSSGGFQRRFRCIQGG